MNYIKELEKICTGREFYDFLEKIDEEGLRFMRNKGYPEIDSLSLTDKYGRRYGNPEPLTSYNGNVGDDAYISYNVCDGNYCKIGRCRLRNCSRHLKLVEKE